MHNHQLQMELKKGSNYAQATTATTTISQSCHKGNRLASVCICPWFNLWFSWWSRHQSHQEQNIFSGRKVILLREKPKPTVVLQENVQTVREILSTSHSANAARRDNLNVLLACSPSPLIQQFTPRRCRCGAVIFKTINEMLQPVYFILKFISSMIAQKINTQNEREPFPTNTFQYLSRIPFKGPLQK